MGSKTFTYDQTDQTILEWEWLADCSFWEKTGICLMKCETYKVKLNKILNLILRTMPKMIHLTIKFHRK